MTEPESTMSEASSPNVNFLEPTFKRSAIVWWSFVGRALFFGSIPTVLAGALLGSIGATVRISPATMRSLTMIVSAFVNIPASIFALQIALGIRYGEFTIRLLPTKAEPSI